MLNRTDLYHHLQQHLDEFAVVAMIGPRQVGKTTLARQLVAAWSGPARIFDLEDPRALARLADPMLTLENLGGLVVLDEVQRLPEIFPILRVLADRPGTPARFLLTGSASPELLRQVSESLAGRVVYQEIGGLDIGEIDGDIHRRWLRGGYPRAWLAPTDAAASRWLDALIRAQVERDLPAMGMRLPSPMIRRFWTMVGHSSGQTWNGAEVARALAIPEGAVRHHLDMLCGTFLVRRLRPWFTNLGKREVRSPKVYVADSGVLHRLLGIRHEEDLLSHPKVGASWEGFVLEQVVARLGVSWDDCWFWGVHTGAELDLLITHGSRRLGFEFKRTSSPTVTPSMRSALEVLELEQLDLVVPGDETFQLAPRIRAVGLNTLWSTLQPLV
jgi:predicted AAA+ superfamily ATPase